MNTVDLHMHSNHSLDGDFDVEQLVKKCYDAGLKVIALADHNSVSGVEQYIYEASKLDMKVIPAIEIDCHYNGVNLHVLGYNIDYTEPAFNEIGHKIIKQEQAAAHIQVELIEKMGFHINHDKLSKLIINGVVTGEMIAEAVLYEPENAGDERLVEFYGEGKLANNPLVNFYWEFCSQGKPANIKIEFQSLEEILEIITDYGGTAVLAHPGNNVKENIELLDGIMNSGIDGIEVYSSYHTEAQTKFYEKYALDNDYLITIGSDFHGKTKPSIFLGEISLPLNQQEKLLESLVK